VAEQRLREFDLIRWIQRKAPADELVLVGVGDDAALVGNRETTTLFTADMLVDGVHFDLAEASPRDVGWKAVACSVSDIAAMGGRCSAAVVSAALPRGFSTEAACAARRRSTRRRAPGDGRSRRLGARQTPPIQTTAA